MLDVVTFVSFRYKYECSSSGIDAVSGDYVVRIAGQKVRDINRLGRFFNLDSQEVLNVSERGFLAGKNRFLGQNTPTKRRAG